MKIDHETSEPIITILMNSTKNTKNVSFEERLRSHLPTDIPDDLFDMVKSGLSYSPEDRFQMLLQL